MNLADLDNMLLLQGLHQLTDAEFFDLCQHNPSLRLERTADHDLIAMPPAGAESSRSSGEVFFQLMLWNRQHQLGYVFESSAGFTLPDGSVRSPDAAWVSRAAYDSLSDEQRQRFPPLCPEFVVEVRSPSDGLTPLRRKMELYLANGVQLALLLDLSAQTATVYQAGRKLLELTGFDREVSCQDVLPGFALDLRPLRR